STRFFYVVQLFLQHTLRHLGLKQVVDTRGAATPLSAVERHKILTSHRAQHSFGSFATSLSIHQVTGGVVSHICFDRARRGSHLGSSKLLAHVANSRAKLRGLLS